MPTTDDPNDPRIGHGPPDKTPVPMNEAYLVLSEEERAKEFVRPVRNSYIHETCGTETTMSRDIAETYARNPWFYSLTYCVACKMHKLVGPDGEFTWEDGTKVGT